MINQLYIELIIMDTIKIVREKFSRDNYAAKLGVVLDDLTETSITMHLHLDPSLNNFYDRPHGGAIYGLADAAFSVLGNNSNNISVAVECSISYHTSPSSGETLYVRGEVISSSRKIGTFLFTVYTEINGDKNIVATMKSTLYRTGKPILGS